MQANMSGLPDHQKKLLKIKECPSWLVTTLTANYKIRVSLNQKTCFQPRPHTAIDLFSEYFKPSSEAHGTS